MMARADEPPDNEKTGNGQPKADDGMFALTEYAVRPRPPRREFQPWHKPRKQYVRRNQWAREIAWLLTRRGDGDQDLRYFGLPGADLLDLRYIHSRFCAGKQRPLRFLGFDSSARPGSRFSEALNISLQEVRSLPYVDPKSDVIGDDFRRMADESSIAWETATFLGPFDVVNLDLCGHFTSDSPRMDASIYNATHALFGLQSRQSRPWCLFLTSRVGRESVAFDTLNTLVARLRENIETCAQFMDAFDGNYTIDFATGSVTDWTAQQFFDAMTMGVAKWLLGLAQTMRNRFSVCSAVGYRVVSDSSATDMLSIVLRFEPELTIARDVSGLATASPNMPTECEQAAGIPTAVSSLVDVDAMLSANAVLRDQLRDESAILLTAARYDPDEYRTWADQQV